MQKKREIINHKLWFLTLVPEVLDEVLGEEPLVLVHQSERVEQLVDQRAFLESVAV